MATKNFRNVIGQGGFGKVYHGSLEDDTQVAVKMPSKSSPKQVMEQFLMEVSISFSSGTIHVSKFKLASQNCNALESDDSGSCIFRLRS